MFRKEVNESSPLRILERSMHGGLGAGNLGVVMARAGVGKTAFLVQVGLDDAMRERPVLHIALHQGLDHVQSWYDALFDDLAQLTALEDRARVRQLVWKHLLIQAYGDGSISPKKLEEAVELFRGAMKFTPQVLLIDGFDWERGGQEATAASLQGFKALAKGLGAELWMTAQTHRSVTREHPTGLTPPCEAYAHLINVAVFLEPQEHHAEVRLLKDHDNPNPDPTHLELDVDTMRLVSDENRSQTLALAPSAYTLLSGGAKGAEAAFGEAAERWGLTELNFSFEGHKVERTRGLVQLTPDDLHMGEVSESYVKAQLHRTFPNTPLFKKILQSIWHQIATAGQVFVVGTIQDDDTVKGGTGWGAELARHFHKPLYVFDQEKKAWFCWEKTEWKPQQETPRIQRPRFAGTGTRFLSDEGRAAIHALFEASFGPAPQR